MKQVLLIVIILFTFIISQLAQANIHSFIRLNTDNGLSSNHVQCILQDSRGYMWFGTANGLNRFNGYEVTIYKHSDDDTTSIGKGGVWSILEDKQGKLWVGTAGGGLNLYNRELDNFIRFTKNDKSDSNINDNNINALFEDSKGNFWIGTGYGGLNLLNRQTGTFTHFVNDPNKKTSISRNAVMCISEDAENNLWIGTWGGGLNKFNYESQTFTSYMFDYNNITPINNAVWTIYEDQKKNLWVGSWGSGLLKFDEKKGKFIRYTHNAIDKNSLSYNVVLSVLEDKEGKLWVGTELGLNIMDRANGTFSIPAMHGNKPDENLFGSSIYKMYEDQQGLIWMGTHAQGINIIDKKKKKFITYNTDDGLVQNYINCSYEDKNNNLWIGTSENGIVKFDRKLNQFQNFSSQNSILKSKFVSSICYFDDNNLLFSTYNGVYLFNVKNNIVSPFYKGNEIENTGIFNYNNRIIYFVTGSKILKLDLKSKKFADYLHTDTISKINSLFFDSKDNLWIGTQNDGIIVRNKEAGKVINFCVNTKSKSSLSDNNISSIIEDKQNNIWIGTSNGLNKYNPTTNTFQHYKEKEGLPSSTIISIIEDKNQNLWISTLEGLSLLNIQKQTFTNYTETDGIPDKAPILQHTTQKGEIVMTGSKGFCVFNPDSIVQNNFLPPIIFTEFKLFNKPVAISAEGAPLKKHISETKEIELTHKQSIFSISWVALNYKNPQEVQYAYKMEGYEKDWNYIGTARTTTYTNLEPGKYTFRVKASNNDGVWNENGSSILFVIHPPFWNTIWFRILLAFFLLAIILAWIRIRTSNLRRHKNILNKLVKERTFELQMANKTLEEQQEEIISQRNFLEIKNIELESQKEKIESISQQLHESDQKRIQFFVNISHEFRTPLTLIVSPLEKILSSITNTNPLFEHLQLINTNAHRLLRLINQLMDIRKLETQNMKLQVNEGDMAVFLIYIYHSFDTIALQQQINYQLVMQNDSLIGWFDYDKIEKIIVNILSNAFKFTPDRGTIMLYLSEIKEKNITQLPPEVESQLKTNNFIGNHYVEIKIKDTGIGMKPEETAKVFDRYYQIDQSKRRTIEGTGIGLNLCKGMVDIHHGAIYLETNLGLGSCFTIILPVFAQQYIDIEISETKLGFEPINDYLTDTIAKESSIQTNDIDLNKNDIIILIVEDNRDLRKFIRGNLTNYKVIEAANGKEGLDKAINEIPDLIISDIMMPEMDGWELCLAIKTDPKTSHIPFILLTAKSLEENFIEGLKIGADDYITKPFSVEMFQLKVRNLIETRKRFRAFVKKGFIDESDKKAVFTADEQFLHRAKGIVEQYILEEKFDVLKFSNCMAMSERQLYRKIKALTDQTVNDFILSVKLKKAAELLTQKQMTIAEVAYSVGFSSPGYFTKCFKEQYGKTPSEFLSGI